MNKVNSLLKIIRKIFVNNNSSDDTYNEVIRICNSEKINNLLLYNYDVDVLQSGNEHSKNYEKYEERSLATYYNWCVDKVNKFNFIKWDCDFFAITDNLVEMINKYNLNNCEESQSIWFSGKTLFNYKRVNIHIIRLIQLPLIFIVFTYLYFMRLLELWAIGLQFGLRKN